MGYYIETPVTIGKANWLLANVPGTVEIPTPVFNLSDEKTLVFVVENGMFDAAAVAYNANEMRRFLKGGGGRKVRYLRVPTVFVIEQLPTIENLLAPTQL